MPRAIAGDDVTFQSKQPNGKDEVIESKFLRRLSSKANGGEIKCMIC